MELEARREREPLRQRRYLDEDEPRYNREPAVYEPERDSEPAYRDERSGSRSLDARPAPRRADPRPETGNRDYDDPW